MNIDFKKTCAVSQSDTVDRLAAVKAAIAVLQAEESALKADLVRSGNTVIEGSLHRATVSHCDGRETIDWAAIAAKLKPSRQLVAAYTQRGEPYDVVRLSAKKTS